MSDFFNIEVQPLALVVDDNPLVRMDMGEMLADLGFAVEEAGSVTDAMLFLERNGDRVSFLLTDVQLPGSRSGTTLANHVSAAWPHIRILVTSGVTRPGKGELPTKAQFLPKPLNEHALIAYVARFPADMLPHRAG